MVNRYTYKLPLTETQIRADYEIEGLTQFEIAQKHGLSQKSVFTAMKKTGVKARVAKPRDQSMEKNKNWKGGRHILLPSERKSAYGDRGYVMIYEPTHPHARSNGYVAEHIKIALKEYGLEKLPSGSCVHHINLKKDDNTPENLEICDYKTHQHHHTMLEELAVKMLLETGLIKFQKGIGYVKA